jgi:hypothetical protein
MQVDLDMHEFKVHHNFKIDTARFEQGKRRSHTGVRWGGRTFHWPRRAMASSLGGAIYLKGGFVQVRCFSGRHRYYDKVTQFQRIWVEGTGDAAKLE